MKHSIKSRLLCVVMVLCFLGLASCNPKEIGQNSKDTSVDSDDSYISKEPTELIEGLDDANGNYRNKEINIVSVSSGIFVGSDDNPLTRAVLERNAILQQYLDLSVNCTEKNADTIKRELMALGENETKNADLICAPVSVLAKIAAEGLLENLYSLPYVDFSSGYLDKTQISDQTVNNTMYMYSGELTNDLSAGTVLFFNKALVSSVGVDPVKLTREGKLTWKKIQTAVQDIADSGAHGIDTLVSEEELAAAVYSSSGMRLITSGDGKDAECAYDGEAAIKSQEIINDLFKSPKYSAQYDKSNAAKAFKEGRLAFLLASINSIGLLSGGSYEWGLVPLPKHSDDQEGYSSALGSNALAVAVPRSCKDSSFSGFALNALSAASAGAIEESLKSSYINYYFWSNDAAVMLNYVARSKHIDIGVVYSSLPEVSSVGVEAILSKNNEKLNEQAILAFRTFADKLFY